ncbi:MAG TPA: cytochrome c [Bryobacteraceae bacterium]|jgi:mono/diheme cytochrome c family protein|nr:cytochrome c [Bryobacteraceae bacterium]
MKKILGALLLLLLAAAGSAFGYLYLRKPAIAPPAEIKIEMTPGRIARGKYLFQILMACDGCHSQHDETRFGRPVVEAGRGRGFQFPGEFDMPGTVVAPNITPDRETGIGAWTDGEKIRAIREGIGRDGRALFPLMPYTNYRFMSDEDVHALVAYLNSLPPVRNLLPRTELEFPVSLMIKTVPQPAGTVVAPPRSDRFKYGEYLATLAYCADCHTPVENGRPVLSKRLAGGREFRTPWGNVVTGNITPDADTGIGKWSEQQFLEKVYQYREYVEKGSPEVGPESFTLMPWLAFAQLPPEDLGAIYTYLMRQPPVHNAVETHPGQPRKTS